MNRIEKAKQEIRKEIERANVYTVVIKLSNNSCLPVEKKSIYNAIEDLRDAGSHKIQERYLGKGMGSTGRTASFQYIVQAI